MSTNWLVRIGSPSMLLLLLTTAVGSSFMDVAASEKKKRVQVTFDAINLEDLESKHFHPTI